MNFTALVAEVMNTVRRPDKLTAVQREVNAALVSFSGDYDFPRDIVELSIAIDPAELTQEFSFNLIPRFRKFWYIKKGGTQCYLCPLERGKLFNKAADMRNRYYFIGSGVRISLDAVVPMLDIGYWQYPPILSDAWPNHWFLENGWPIIYNRACAKVFADIGDDASASKHERAALNDFLTFRTSHVR